jgi:hypothetical protein
MSDRPARAEATLGERGRWARPGAEAEYAERLRVPRTEATVREGRAPQARPAREEALERHPEGASEARPPAAGACAAAAPEGGRRRSAATSGAFRLTPDASSTVLPGNDRYERRGPTRSQTAAISLARAARSTQESDSQQDLYGRESRAVGAWGVRAARLPLVPTPAARAFALDPHRWSPQPRFHQRSQG